MTEAPVRVGETVYLFIGPVLRNRILMADVEEVGDRFALVRVTGGNQSRDTRRVGERWAVPVEAIHRNDAGQACYLMA